MPSKDGVPSFDEAAEAVTAALQRVQGQVASCGCRGPGAKVAAAVMEAVTCAVANGLLATNPGFNRRMFEAAVRAASTLGETGSAVLALTAGTAAALAGWWG